MTREEILAIGRWREPDELRLALPIAIFGAPTEVRIHVDRPGVISDRSVVTVAQLRALDDAALARMKALIWDNCLSNCEDSSYGFDVREGQTETEANLENFGVSDAESAYAHCSPPIAAVYETDHEDYAANYARLTFDNGWESHLMTIIVRDGVVVGGGESGTWIGRFEKGQ